MPPVSTLRDRAAAGRDARDIEAAQRNALPREHAVGGQRRLPVRDQRDIGAGPAHVERHQIGNAEQIGAATAAGNAAGRSRQHRARGKTRGFSDRRHAAMRQHDEQTALEAGLVKTLLEIGQIAPHDRLDIGVHDRGRDALIFLDLRQHVAGSGDADIRQFSRQAFDRGKFMGGIEIGMQEANRDRGRAGFLDRGDGIAERGGIERYQDLATRLQPFAHAKTPLARHQRLRRRRAQIVAVGLEAFAHLDDVAMAFGGEQRDFRALALQQRVGGNRRAMHQAIGRAPASPRA